MLDATLKTQLKAYLEKVVHPLELVASLDDSAKAREMKELLLEIAELSDKISLVERTEAGVRTPSFSINRAGTDIGVRFAAIPMGHEFTSLVLALLQVGGHTIKFDEAVIEQIRNLEGDYEFETFMSLTCHNCPDVVQALNAMSVINPRIKVTTIDGGLFKEVEERQIMAVPMMFLNGQHFGQGRTSVEEILAKLDTNAGACGCRTEQERRVRRADRRRWPCRRRCGDLRCPQRHPYRRAGRAFRRPGAGYAGDRKLHLGQGDRRAEVCHRAGTARQGIRRRHHEHPARQQAGQGRQTDRSADRIGRSAESQVGDPGDGARWREINVPGEQEYRNHGVAYCPHCDGPLFKGKRVSVIGGGNSGVEAAIDLAGLVST
jgi:alkyl hydroperoxide reductase subunit F